MRFAAIDFETANSKLSSICQVGISVFQFGKEAATLSILIDPQDYFDPNNSMVHGITEANVIGKPNFAQAYVEFVSLLNGAIVVSHSWFDRTALTQSCRLHHLAFPNCTWLNTIDVARSVFPQFVSNGYGLANMAKEFGFDFNHHDALEDARVTGAILIKAIEDSGFSLEDWVIRLNQTKRKYSDKIKLVGKELGPLTGEVCVFTGELKISREKAAKIANDAGAAIDSSVTKRTTIVIVGDQDLERLAGKMKSSKHLKAEELASKGQPIRILQERDFVALLD